MPPKNKFSREQIIDAAFDVADSEGIEGITAKRIADKLVSSVAPIYVNFKDIEELKEAVVSKLFKISQRLSEETYTDDLFLNIGIASLRLAKEHNVLFRDLVLTKNKYVKKQDPAFTNELIHQMAQESTLVGFDKDELASILLKMRIFSLGLAAMIANDFLPPEHDEATSISLLSSMGQDVIAAARLKKQNH